MPQPIIFNAADFFQVNTYGVGKWQLIQTKYYKALKGRSSQNIKVRLIYDLVFFRCFLTLV